MLANIQLTIGSLGKPAEAGVATPVIDRHEGSKWFTKIDGTGRENTVAVNDDAGGVFQGNGNGVAQTK